MAGEASAKPSFETAKPSFEAQMGELEKVVEQLERGDLPLEESVSLFERGMQLSNACRTELASAESRIQVLLNPKENGPVEVEELGVDVAEGEEDEDEDYPDDEDGE